MIDSWWFWFAGIFPKFPEILAWRMETLNETLPKSTDFFRFWGMISWGSPTVAMFEGYRCPQCPRSKQHRSIVAFNHAHLPGAVVTQKNLRYRRKMVPWNTDEVMAIDSLKGSLVEVGEIVSEPELQNIQLDSLMKSENRIIYIWNSRKTHKTFRPENKCFLHSQW